MVIEAVAEVPIPVSSQDRALAFYAGTLTLELARADAIMPGVRRIQLAPSQGAPVLTLATWPESMPPGWLRGLVLRSGSVQAGYHRLVAAGVESDGPPCARPGHPAEAVFYDPDGNKFVLKAGRRPLGGQRQARNRGFARKVADRRNGRMA